MHLSLLPTLRSLNRNACHYRGNELAANRTLEMVWHLGFLQKTLLFTSSGLYKWDGAIKIMKGLAEGRKSYFLTLASEKEIEKKEQSQLTSMRNKQNLM